MISLAIDTSTEICSVALGNEAGLIAESSLEAGMSHLQTLLPQTHGLLREHGASLADVGRIVAGTGPGTFTGLRIGVATGRALAQALAVPLFGFSSLKALAGAIASGEGHDRGSQDILPVIDAKRGQVFAQLFANEGEDEKKLVEKSAVWCLNPEALISRLPDFTPNNVLAAGNGSLVYRRLFEGAPQVEFVSENDPRHKVSAAFHLRLMDGTSRPGTPHDVLPVYVRDPDADRTVLLRKREPWLK